MHSGSKKTILITGGTGYLGSYLVKALCNKYKILLLKRSFSSTKRIESELGCIKIYDIDKSKIAQIFEDNEVDLVLHCATHYGRKCNDPLEIVDANLILPLSLLHQSRLNKVPCFINTDTILDKGINTYSLSKSHFSDWLKILASDTVCINLKLEHFYGPLDDSSKFVTYLIHSMLKNEPEIQLTKGEQLRYFLHIQDVVDAFSLIIEKSDSMGNGYHEYHIGATECISIRNLTEIVKKVTGNTITKLNFGAIPYRENEIMKPKIDITGLLNTGWVDKIPLKLGLEETIKIEREILGL